MRGRNLRVVASMFQLWGRLFLFRRVVPDLYLKDLLDFTPENFPEQFQGIEGIIFDWESTLAPHGTMVVFPGVKDYLVGLAKDFKMGVYTNKHLERNGRRARDIGEKIIRASGIRMLYPKVCKPMVRGFNQAMEELEIYDPLKFAYVGDALATDMMGAQNAGFGLIVLVNTKNRRAEPLYMHILGRPLEWTYKLVTRIKHTKV